MASHHHHDLWSEQAGQTSRQIVATLVGGVLILASFAAGFLFPASAASAPDAVSTLAGGGLEHPRNFYADALAFFGALLLGVPLVVSAAKDLWHGHSHMDELVALAVLAAFATGEYQTAGAVAFFMLLSTLIESRTAQGARASIESLVRITPTRACRLSADGKEEDVEAKDLKPGDRVRVRPGDNIPGDGKVLSGASTVNQANITGESLPADKNPGDEVYGGTINLTGALEIEITKSGADTTLGKVQELILQAERTRTPITRLIDRYARWYTPTILMLAGIVLFFTKDMNRAISMLVIACPCALVLAMPTAMVAALSAAARLGVLVKKVTDLETARSLTAIVFDKTGTLTTGNLSVSRLTPAPGVDGAELLRAAAAAEQNSRHPVAKAVVEVAKRAKLEWEAAAEFEEVGGKGVRAKLGGDEILVGRANWLRERGMDVAALEMQSAAEAEGLSVLYVTRAGKALGWIGLEDRTRPDAAKALDDLRGLGLKQLLMITGDRKSVAQRVAAEMHCTSVMAEALPAQKLERVDELKRAGHTVAVVGDGVNDAPALAAGNISIAMGAAGSDVAIHSASIALMNNNLNRIPFLVRLSRRTGTVVMQNLVFGIGFIAVLLAASAYGQLHAIQAAALHAAGSVVVLFNSARLVREGEDLEHAAPPAPAATATPEAARA